MAEIKEKVDHMGNAIREQAGKTADKAKSAVGNQFNAAKDAIHDATSGAADMATKAAEKVSETAKEWMGAAEDTAKNATKSVQSVATDAAETVGDFSQELVQVIRRNPIPAVVAALGIGFVMAMVLRRGSSS